MRPQKIRVVKPFRWRGQLLPVNTELEVDPPRARFLRHIKRAEYVARSVASEKPNTPPATPTQSAPTPAPTPAPAPAPPTQPAPETDTPDTDTDTETDADADVVADDPEKPGAKPATPATPATPEQPKGPKAKSSTSARSARTYSRRDLKAEE